MKCPNSRFYRLTTPGVALMKCPNSSATLRALGQPWAPGPGCGTGSFGNSWVRRPSTSAVGCVDVGNSREHNVRRTTETRKKNEFFRRSAVYRLRGAVHSLRGQLHRPGRSTSVRGAGKKLKKSTRSAKDTTREP